jgi:uncharacterized damage-inducible protein DinB
MTPEDIRALYQYNSWANHRLLDACEPLTPEQFTRDLRSSFPSVRDTLAHILGAEWLWHERFQSRSPSNLLNAVEFSTVAELRSRWSTVEGDLLRYVNGLTAEDLARVFQFRTTAGEIYPSPLWQALQHLANHSTYHRGQVVAFLRQLGLKGVALDLIRFYRERASAAGA